jgi:hypothetical protein
MKSAQVAFGEHARASALRQQIANWQFAEQIRDFCSAADGLDSETADQRLWLGWARKYAERIDPLSHDWKSPMIPDPDLEDLRPFLGRWSPHGPDALW